ncbi:MAG: hypothetical protein K9N35_12160 [Candidatus Marinimicrobia bacterium]|nr:hypothetical protein [Candidatus Neomarinimicrobiota bacterium]
MLVAVIMAFVVLSFTGVAVLEVGYSSKSTSLETVENIVLQYEVESSINEALWKINIGEDSLVNFDQDGIICSWDPETQILTVNVDNGDVATEVELDLSEDTHFQRGFASNNTIMTNNFNTGIEEENQLRRFNFLPAVDLEYFYDHKVKVHNGNDASWKDDYLEDEGIHIFTGNNLMIDSVSLENSTLVFTGKGITFTGTNTIKAPLPVDSEDALPALVFLDPDEDFTLSSGDHIEGAIYCAGQLNIENPTLTGPIISKFISLNDDIDLLDDEFSEYYRWTAGFGSKDDYDWPKQINRWNTKSWVRKLNV